MWITKAANSYFGDNNNLVINNDIGDIDRKCAICILIIRLPTLLSARMIVLTTAKILATKIISSMVLILATVIICMTT